MSINIVDIHGSIEGDYDILCTIPDNATNGDVMIAIYGIVDVEVNERSVRLFPKDGGQLWVTRDWWDTPCKGGKADVSKD